MLDIVKVKDVPSDIKDASSLAVRKILYVPASLEERTLTASVPAADHEKIPPGIFRTVPALPPLGTNI